MTLDFYELKEQPFGASPDPRFLYLSSTHRQAFASLLRALQAGRGLVTLSAQPGLGKTTLLFHTLSSFGDKVATVYILQNALTPIGLLRAILADLGVREIDENSEAMLSRLTDVLLEEHRLGKRIIVVIDDAQNLDTSVFELLCTLSNLEKPRGKLIQFILCGQPLLSDKLAAIKPLQWMQRGGPIAHLEPFSALDTAQYVDHRLRTAGYARQAPLFSPDAAALVARYSQGNPRTINNLCFEALSVACTHKRERIGADTVREVAATLDLADWKQESIFVRPLQAPTPALRTQPLVVSPARSAPQPEVAVVAAPKRREESKGPQRKPALPTPPSPPPLAIEEPVPAQPEPLVASKEKRIPVLSPQAESVPAPPCQLAPSKSAINETVIPVPSLQLAPSQVPARKSGIALHSLALRPFPGLTVAAALLLAVIGAIFGVYRAKTPSPHTRQVITASPLLYRSAPVVQQDQQRTVIAMAPKAAAAPSTAEPDLKGMDLESALRALAAEKHRQHQNQLRKAR
jgi:general secretion pathway protein A